MRILLSICIMAVIIPVSLAQINGITVDMGLYTPDIKVFFINDFDLTQSGNSPLLFWVNIVNTGDTTTISIKLTIHYNSLTSGDTELANGTSEPFTIPPGLTRITNQELFSKRDIYELKEYTINESAANELMDAIYATGKLPTGQYAFHITVLAPDQGGVSVEDELIIDVQNPSILDLISPGTAADEPELMELYTTLPFFQWESDATSFRIRICEKLASNTSPEDVMNNEPRLETTVTTPSFQYPAAHAFPLAEGKTYYWQVIASTPSSSGPIEFESEIWAFKIANFSRGATNMLQMQILNYLRLLLGDDVVEPLFDEQGSMNGFYATGVILHNGRQISQQDLNALIEAFMAGRIKISNYNTE